MVKISFNELFGNQNPEEQENQGTGYGLNKPKRHADPPMRPEPRQPDSHAQDPWFVAPEPKNTNKPSMKRIVKRTVSILFPIAGLLALIGVILYVVNVVVETYG